MVYFAGTYKSTIAIRTGEKGVGQLGKPLHYKGCPFHRVIKVNGWMYYLIGYI